MLHADAQKHPHQKDSYRHSGSMTGYPCIVVVMRGEAPASWHPGLACRGAIPEVGT